MAENQPAVRPIRALVAAGTLVVAFVGVIAILCTESRPADLGECPTGCEPEMKLVLAPATNPGPGAKVVRVTVTNCTGADHGWDSEWAAMLRWHVWRGDTELAFQQTQRLAPTPADREPPRITILRSGRFLSQDVALNKSVRVIGYDFVAIPNSPHPHMQGYEAVGRFSIGDGPVDIQIEYINAEPFIGVFSFTPDHVKMWDGTSRSNKLRLN